MVTGVRRCEQSFTVSLVRREDPVRGDLFQIPETLKLLSEIRFDSYVVAGDVARRQVVLGRERTHQNPAENG